MRPNLHLQYKRVHIKNSYNFIKLIQLMNKKCTWGSPGGTVMQLVHPWRSSAVISGRIFTATRTHCAESGFLAFVSVCSISNEVKTAIVLGSVSNVSGWRWLGFGWKGIFGVREEERVDEKERKKERKGLRFSKDEFECRRCGF